MPKLKLLSSDEIINILQNFGFEKVSQKGSHVKLSRQTSFQKQVLTIPNSKQMKKGTIKGIFNPSKSICLRRSFTEVFL